ncbi:unnamed protein product [Fusarium fujikuroi]|uniref:Uncharacterized protein n=1 Tax=Fusarium fujikuroi TaxID=5127 RepID=A0A9Q9RYA2_FUSFU|nr:Uncharacterized protein Y057_4765 [Fusarium fujikuroi]VTT79308.1 unnamed protein product [Fusarium fujikuroi]VTT80337.1 unnamed protein product [Fusarium fujikuroi]VZH90450.1 unnamed protein product [Fusarium fujikuroi]
MLVQQLLESIADARRNNSGFPTILGDLPRFGTDIVFLTSHVYAYYRTCHRARAYHDFSVTSGPYAPFLLNPQTTLNGAVNWYNLWFLVVSEFKILLGQHDIHQPIMLHPVVPFRLQLDVG